MSEIEVKMSCFCQIIMKKWKNVLPGRLLIFENCPLRMLIWPRTAIRQIRV